MKKTHILLSIICLTVWLSVNAKDEPYTVIVNPGENAAKSARVNWHTDQDINKSWCFYTKATDKNWKNVKKVKASSELITAYDSLYSKTAKNENFYEYPHFIRHTAELKKLEPATEYMYRVGSENTGTIRYFKTAPKSNEWTAAVISDFHSYSPLPNRTKAAMAMLDTLRSVNGENFDVMLHIGDICAWGGSYSFWRNLYEQPWFKNYMWAGVNGNHDNMDRRSSRNSNEYFRYANNNPLNGYKGEEGVCYFFKYGDVLFIMLNNENMRKAEGLEAAQEWVKKVIKKNPAKFVVVIEHYQWFYGNNGKFSQYSRWHELFDEYGVDLAIAGNNHIYARTNAIYQDKETDGTKGTVYLQTPSSDNERGHEKLDEWTDNKDLLKIRWSEGQRTVGALIFKSSADKLTLTLYDRHGNPVDSVDVLAKNK